MGLLKPAVDSRGATSTEYALLLVFIAAAIVTALTVFGSSLVALFDADWPW